MSDRIEGSLEPTPDLMDSPGELQSLQDQQEDRRASDEANAAALTPDERLQRLRNRCETFELAVSTQVRLAIDQMKVARDGRSGRSGVYARFQREREKYRNEQMAQTNQEGEIILLGKDAHLKTGNTLGLFADSVNTTTAALNKAVLGNGSNSWNLEAVGERQENDEKTTIIRQLLLDQLEQGKIIGHLTQGFVDIPQHGAVTFRQTWLEQTRWVRNRSQKWVEKTVKRGSTVRHWPLINVYLANPNSPYAEDQTAVVWYSRLSLSELALNERRVVMEDAARMSPMTGQVEPTIEMSVRGRFINLERLRHERMKESGSAQVTEQSIMSSSGPIESTNQLPARPGQVSAEKLMDLYEFQGWFPIGDYVRRGELDAEMLQYYGIDLTLEGDIAGNAPATPESVEATARLCDAIMWYISVTENNNLVECQPCPYREPRTELISGYYIPTSEFYGMSADKLAGDIGDTADAVLNNIVEILDSNANPKPMVNKAALGDGSDDEEKVRKMLYGKGQEDIIFVNGGPSVKPSDVVAWVMKEYDASYSQLLERLIETYNLRTLTSQLSKGGAATTQSKTLGEAQEQLAGVGERLGEIAVRLSDMQIVVPILTNILKDLDWFMTDKELADYAKRIAGKPALDWEDIFPTAEDEGPGDPARPLYEDFRVTSAAQAAMEREVAIQFMMNMDTTLQTLPTFNREQNAREMYQEMGKDPDRYFVAPGGPMSPRVEFESILAGDNPKVQPMEDSLNVHLPAHAAQMQILQGLLAQAQQKGQDTTALEGWVTVLEAHILATVDQAQIQMLMMAQQQAQMQAEAQAAGGSKKGGKVGSKPLQPGSGNEIKNGISSSAKQTPTSARP